MIINRALETQADLKACEYTSPKLGFIDNQMKACKAKAKENNSTIHPIIHYYKSLYDTHPTWSQCAEDISLQIS